MMDKAMIPGRFDGAKLNRDKVWFFIDGRAKYIARKEKAAQDTKLRVDKILIEEWD